LPCCLEATNKKLLENLHSACLPAQSLEVFAFRNIMKFLEKDLEQIIYDTDNELLVKKGLHICGKKYRQIKIGNYGICDLITVSKFYDYYGDDMDRPFPVLKISVIELKKNEISVNTFLQAVRYLKGIQRYLEFREKHFEVRYDIILIGDNIESSSDFLYLTDLIESYGYNTGFNLKFYTYGMDINGLNFTKECGYKLTTEGFDGGK